LHHILDTAKDLSAAVRGRIIPTPRNNPVRNLYRDNGFNEAEAGLWERRL
jgi:predicted enzyme involved in methoxymalonyl-ACP biosynthesis